jgi:hypothetical protein
MVANTMDEDFHVLGMSPGSFITAAHIRGVESIMMGINFEPDLVRKLVTKAAEFCEQVQLRCIDAGVSASAATSRSTWRLPGRTSEEDGRHGHGRDRLLDEVEEMNALGMRDAMASPVDNFSFLSSLSVQTVETSRAVPHRHERR